MKFLILAALVAVAAARPQNYQDDVFHFSSNVHPSTGFERSSVQRTFVKEVQPSYVVKSAPVVSQYVQKVHVAEPVYSQVHHHVVNQPSSLVRTVEEEVPAVTSVHHVQQPAVFSQVSNVHHQIVPTTSVVASRSSFAPLQYTNQYSNQYTNQYTNQYSAATPVFKILKQVQDVDPSGNYHINYETENGITLNEQGTLKDVQAKEGPVAQKEGSYSYTGPDGVVYTVNYIADEFGFRASGAHLPVAPEIPAEIQRSLELIASQPEKYDENGNLISKKF